MEADIEEEKQDSVFGRLDCNDNTPVLKPRVYPNKVKSSVICDVTAQNQAFVAICHLPQIQF